MATVMLNGLTRDTTYSVRARALFDNGTQKGPGFIGGDIVTDSYPSMSVDT